MNTDPGEKPRIVIVAGPTASGKSKEAIRIAKERNGEIISVDSRQVYRGLDIGTEKITADEMSGIPHHLIDIREPSEPYNAGDFVHDAKRLISEIHERGKLPILAGGSHFYFDALLYDLPPADMDEALRETLEQQSTEELGQQVAEKDPERFAELDPKNRRRLIRALELITTYGRVPRREKTNVPYEIEWIILNPPAEELRARIDGRLQETLDRGLVEEVRNVRALVGDTRLNELGLEYRIVGEYLRDERTEASLLPGLSSRLWHYARRQKAWLRKLETENSKTF